MQRIKSKRHIPENAPPRELGEGVERNRLACRVVESLVRNWVEIVKSLREGRTEGDWRVETNERDGLARVRWR